MDPSPLTRTGFARSPRRGTVLRVNPPAEPARRPPSRQGLVEYLLVVAFVALAIVGALALFGDEIRAALGPAPTRPPP